MAKRRWIIGKRMRNCPRYCDGTSRVTITDEETGKLLRTCRGCGAQEEANAHSFKDLRACEGCKHVRDVTVHLWETAGKGIAEHYEQFCDACRYEASAASHLKQAKDMAAKAKAIRTSRTHTYEPGSDGTCVAMRGRCRLPPTHPEHALQNY